MEELQYHEQRDLKNKKKLQELLSHHFAPTSFEELNLPHLP